MACVCVCVCVCVWRVWRECVCVCACVRCCDVCVRARVCSQVVSRLQLIAKVMTGYRPLVDADHSRLSALLADHSDKLVESLLEESAVSVPLPPLPRCCLSQPVCVCVSRCCCLPCTALGRRVCVCVGYLCVCMRVCVSLSP